MSEQHVTKSAGALYSPPRTSHKRRRCDGHLTDRHWIEPGEQAVFSALPPHDSDIGNEGWWHAVFCLSCAPLSTLPSPIPGTPGEREEGADRG